MADLCADLLGTIFTFVNVQRFSIDIHIMQSKQPLHFFTSTLPKPSTKTCSFIGILGTKNEKIMKYTCGLFFLFIFCTSCQKQDKTESPKNDIKSEITKEVITSQGPKGITRTIIQDRKGDIWFGADGVYRYDGNTISTQMVKWSGISGLDNN